MMVSRPSTTSRFSGLRSLWVTDFCSRYSSPASRSSARRRWAVGSGDGCRAIHWRSVSPPTRSMTSVRRPSTILVRSMTRTTFGMIEARQHLVLATQGVLGGVFGACDLERARAAADQVARGVDDGHPALPEPRHDLVVGADARAWLEVVGVERNATDVRESRLRLGRRIPPYAHRLDGFTDETGNDRLAAARPSGRRPRRGSAGSAARCRARAASAGGRT